MGLLGKSVFTAANAKVGMIFADIELVEFDDGRYQEVGGSLYELLEVVDGECAMVICVDHDDADYEPFYLRFPFEGILQASGVQFDSAKEIA